MHNVSLLGRDRVVVHSFAEGSRIVKLVPPVRNTEQDVLARAMYLATRGREDEAWELLDKYVHEHPINLN